MNFKDIYGEIGTDFIHIHHLIPVCPNCHSMLHKKINGKLPTVEELRKMINKQN